MTSCMSVTLAEVGSGSGASSFRLQGRSILPCDTKWKLADHWGGFGLKFGEFYGEIEVDSVCPATPLSNDAIFPSFGTLVLGVHIG